MLFGRILCSPRCLACSAWCVALIGVGGILYCALPPEPRWTLNDGPKSIMFLAGDVVVTGCMRGNEACGPVQFWDVATGHEVERCLTDEPLMAWYEPSPDFRWLAVVTDRVKGKQGTRSIRLVDVRQRKESAAPAPIETLNYMQTSPGYDLLAAGEITPDGGITHVIVDMRTGHVVDRFTKHAQANDEKSRKPIRPDGIFTEDGKWFIVSYVQNGTQYTRVANLRAEESLVLDNAMALGVALDSQSLIVDRGEDGVWIWDMPTKEWRCQVEAASADVTLLFSPDRKLMALMPMESNPPKPLKFFDVKTGRLYWELPADNYSGLSFAPDGRSFGVYAQGGPTGFRRIVGDVPGKKHVWEKRCEDDAIGPLLFTADSQTVIASSQDRVEIIDAATGETRSTIEAPGQMQPQANLAADGRALLIDQRPFPGRLAELRHWMFPGRPRGVGSDDPKILHVVDLTSGHQLARLPGDLTEDAMVTADLKSLVSIRDERGPGVDNVGNSVIVCYDLPPRIAWHWVLGVPAVLGVTTLAMWAGWRWLRRKS